MKKTSYERYEELLKSSGYSTSDVCSKTGINQSAISNWKIRGGNPTAENLFLIAKYFGVPMEYFIE